jgi:hypothetical protein
MSLGAALALYTALARAPLVVLLGSWRAEAEPPREAGRAG